MQKNRAFKAVFAALAIGLAPAAEVLPSSWGQQNLVVPDGPRAGTKWDPSLTPHLVEPLDHLAVTSSTNLVVVKKSAQVGFTQLGQVWLGYIVDVAPARTLVVQPTTVTAHAFNKDKLSPSIQATPILRGKIKTQLRRSAESSTSLNKRFAGGSITLTGANSAADLRGKTVKYAFADEVNEWPLDLDKQGDPLGMLEARQIAFLQTGDWKRLIGSTPTLKGGRIDALFDAGDQRYWHMPCPQCGEFQKFVFGDGKARGGLRFNREWPYEAYYACVHCDYPIEHWQKEAMVRAGHWVAENPGPGRYPSYHMDALSSLLVPWDEIAAKFWESKDDPTKLKLFWNLWLGLGWEERGDAPDWKPLHNRRQAYRAGTIPLGGLVLTGGADVQKDGIYFEVVAWGASMRSWTVDVGFIVGDPADEAGAVWTKLTEVSERTYRAHNGSRWPIEAFAIDSGYLSHQVYHWARGRPIAYAIKGEDGWYRPPVGTPTKVDITLSGRKLRRGCLLWPVGTWPLKSKLYANLRKEGVAEGADEDPPGYLSFGEFQDERYFQQLTSEHLADVKDKAGRIHRRWLPKGENHYHDCRIYNMAIAEHLGLSRMEPDEWAQLQATRDLAPPSDDLITLMRTPFASSTKIEPSNAAGVEGQEAAPPTQVALSEPTSRTSVDQARRPAGTSLSAQIAARMNKRS